MNIAEVYKDEVKNLVEDSTTDVDARSVIRRKPFVVTENEFVERIIHLEVNGSLDDFRNGTFHADIRMDSHVMAIIRTKQPINGDVIPFVGDIVSASHVDISALTRNTRVKILEISRNHIVLSKKVWIPARASIRLMDVEHATNFSDAKCRCCSEVKRVPLFHGIPGYCRECNETIIRPLKAEIGGYLQNLLDSAFYYEEDHNPRTFERSEIELISRNKGRLNITVSGERINAHLNYETGLFHEVLDRQSYGAEATFDGMRHTINGKAYRMKVHNWAKGLATKMKELRVNRNDFSPKPFDGLFINKDCYGDQTLLHMRRMYNIAKAKWMMEKRIRTKEDAIACIEKADLIMNQPDCSRRLHMIISDQVSYAATKLEIANNFETEIAQKIVGIMTAIQVGLENTSTLDH